VILFECGKKVMLLGLCVLNVSSVSGVFLVWNVCVMLVLGGWLIMLFVCIGCFLLLSSSVLLLFSMKKIFFLVVW